MSPFRLTAAPRAWAVALALSALPFLSPLARAHEGHDDGAPKAPISKTIAPRGAAASAAFELVAIPKGEAIVFYLDRFATGEPITDATLEVETPAGPATAEAAADGSYRLPAPWLVKRDPKDDHLDLVVTVTAGADVDVLPLTVALPAAGAPAAEAGHAEEGWLHRLTELLTDRLAARDPGAGLAAAGGFLLGLAAMGLMRAGRRVPVLAVLVLAATLVLGAAAFAHEGDHPESRMAFAPPPADLAQRLPDGAVFVPKPTQRLLSLRTVIAAEDSYRRTVSLPGRIIPDPNASGVVQSSVGGRLAPPPSGTFPRLGTKVSPGEVLALVTPPVQRVDQSDMRQRQGELDQQIAIVQRRVDRFLKLAPSGAVSQVQLEEAQDELKGLKDRRTALDRIRQEPEVLVAPVGGVIAEAAAVAGQMAASGQMVFQIVDPGKLWVEALSFDALTPASDATARLADGRSLPLAYQGAGLADRNQAIPVQFGIRGGSEGLRVGQFVTVLAATDTEQRGLAVPRASVVRTANGQDVVYAHTAAERYEARPVRVAPLDGTRVLVEAGVKPGTRVVVQGAELLDQVR
ncbi:efflux RND transporter periplasmic adaptor subunit [Methylobacterium nonmethylotrophicum]|uniref:HlyD family efflux transporter periplasmic adaptor subunit n=1 Tax=Methylobacterium nonmethylotrophicum TaxID=1141884 RepID=A0A4Z0NJR5_9HYPH|nr:HlyD family efflux transporter periplasmic adaptor subunit [Methylobacterium nonmethylotrophicum]TGD95844.1 HlyD family efflux transporter periplasmic adaptor subunit [Methylobacterium nonmethylotrophicum]